jgi:3-isopropylmalate dehydrogenase
MGVGATDKKPEGINGLLRLRSKLGLYAKLCPAAIYDVLVDISPLKPEAVTGLDMIIVREVSSGIFFGEPRGIQTLGDGTRRGINTEEYTTEQIGRIARVAFEVARTRSRRVCSVDKANALASSQLWREEVQSLRDTEYRDIELSHMYVDNASMQLIRHPRQFDVMLTTNMFGDILSDAAASLIGSLGLMPTAELSSPVSTMRQRGLYQAIHGSAPDIAGKDLANPIGSILSFAMLLRYSLGMDEDASLIETAVGNVLRRGLRTRDIMQPGKSLISTTQMGEAIKGELDHLAA